MEPFFDTYKPNRIIPPEGIDKLLALGWFRMHQHIFTCSHVNLGGVYRVHWLRFALDSVKDCASHRKLRKKNNNFTFSIEPFRPDKLTEEYRQLHLSYRLSINFDGANSIEECLLGDDYQNLYIFNTQCISMRHQNKLIAVGYFDTGQKSAASILHFYDPAYKKHSLGKFLILLTLDFLKAHGFTWYYPGYIVEGLRKMDYKLFVGKEVEYFMPEELTWAPFSVERKYHRV